MRVHTRFCTPRQSYKKKTLNLIRTPKTNALRVYAHFPNHTSFNSVINALGMAGRWRDALAVMEDMVMEGGVAPNSVTYASAINACGNARQLERALGLLREARLAGIKVGWPFAPCSSLFII